MQKKISIWGATGSIGTQALDVIHQQPGRFKILTLTSNSRVELLYAQAKMFRPERVVITGDVDRDACVSKFKSLNIPILWGKAGLLEAAASSEENLVVNALVGGVGLEVTMKAIDAGVSIALANKEVLVMAGELVTQKIRQKGVSLLPIDSEHSAIFQCLQGEPPEAVREIILTASGGPFLNRNASEFPTVTPEEALAHPNWNMGRKITIDSATMLNKCLEIIEARWLFGVSPDQIRVVIHPQSVIHSMVSFRDGSIKAQLSVPDMRVAIAYALSYPGRWQGNYGGLSFNRIHKLDFIPPDTDKFPALNLAYRVLEAGGTAPVALNAADEVAVDLFLNRQIRFDQISQLIETALDEHELIENPSLEDILMTDQQIRLRTAELAVSMMR